MTRDTPVRLQLWRAINETTREFELVFQKRVVLPRQSGIHRVIQMNLVCILLTLLMAI